MTLFDFGIMNAKSSKPTWSWFVSKEFISEDGSYKASHLHLEVKEI